MGSVTCGGRHGVVSESGGSEHSCLRIHVCTARSDILRAVSKNILPKEVNEAFHRMHSSFLVTLHKRSHVSSVYILVEVVVPSYTCSEACSDLDCL
jgi:hypothetical protein